MKKKQSQIMKLSLLMVTFVGFSMLYFVFKDEVSDVKIKLYSKMFFQQGPGSAYNYTNPKASKTIQSQEIVLFSYTFSCIDLNQYYGRNIPYERIDFKLKKENDQARCQIWDDKGLINLDFICPDESLMHLQSLVKNHNLVRVNGMDEGVMGIVETNATHLNIEYASNERIYASDNRGRIFYGEEDIALYDFFMDLADQYADGFDRVYDAIWEPHKILVGTWLSEEENVKLVFDQKHLSVYEDNVLCEKSPYFLQQTHIHRKSSSGEFETLFALEWKEGGLSASYRDRKTYRFYKV